MEPFLKELFSGYLVFFILFILGLLEMVVISVIKKTRQAIIDRGYLTQGSIVDNIKSQGSKGGITYYPVIQFTTFMNEQVKQKTRIGTNSIQYPVGTLVDVYYDPDKPERFVLKEDKNFRIMLLIMGSLCAILFLVGLGGIIHLYLKHFSN